MNGFTPVKLTGLLIEGFAGAFLSPMYDEPSPTPRFHREGWDLYASQTQFCGLVAPRGHAKSTAFTHDYCLAAALFRVEQFIVLVSATEDLAINHLGDIAKELSENGDLREEFGIVSLPIDAKTEIVVRFDDGYECRIVVKGSGQKMRGLKWRGKRPGLIICDDLEEDEQVENRDRRVKFRNWFFRALVPSLRKRGKVRIHGTILHEDSLLNRLLKDKTWKMLFYKAHESFDDFSNILWPERFDEVTLREKRQSFIEQQDAAGYSQEYLNDPFDNSDAYLRRDDFIAMSERDYDAPKKIVAGADFAVSKADRANRTSFTVAGKCIDNLLHFTDQYVGRWDTLEWIEVMFDIQKRWNPDVFFVEDGVIWKSISPTLYKEMQKRDCWINCFAIPSTKDKATRGRPFQRRMRAGGCRFDKQAEWYVPYESELLRFTGVSEALLDDQFDSSAIIAKGLDLLGELEEEDFIDDEEMEMREHDPRKLVGRNAVTGY
jgi:hypothetical protein